MRSGRSSPPPIIHKTPHFSYVKWGVPGVLEGALRAEGKDPFLPAQSYPGLGVSAGDQNRVFPGVQSKFWVFQYPPLVYLIRPPRVTPLIYKVKRGYNKWCFKKPGGSVVSLTPQNEKFVGNKNYWASEEKKGRERESYKIKKKSLQAKTRRVKSDRFFNTT
jgi:hypothetical protein